MSGHDVQLEVERWRSTFEAYKKEYESLLEETQALTGRMEAEIARHVTAVKLLFHRRDLLVTSAYESLANLAHEILQQQDTNSRTHHVPSLPFVVDRFRSLAEDSQRVGETSNQVGYVEGTQKMDEAKLKLLEQIKGLEQRRLVDMNFLQDVIAAAEYTFGGEQKKYEGVRAMLSVQEAPRDSLTKYQTDMLSQDVENARHSADAAQDRLTRLRSVWDDYQFLLNCDLAGLFDKLREIGNQMCVNYKNTDETARITYNDSWHAVSLLQKHLTRDAGKQATRDAVLRHIFAMIYMGDDIFDPDETGYSFKVAIVNAVGEKLGEDKVEELRHERILLA
ncbi:hypothetical protein B0H63DRAFT_559290 [Podospora didyma]|uniref:Uncharacterized protein n=1 Tax=Podospora didyma TaxID=330526 RepID=A0AAE0NU91_9PEZI|nr:hypothetical protein B0H63DRAFT_559290 [Podospora didyma]